MKVEYCTIKQFDEIVKRKKIIAFGASKLAREFILEYPIIATRISFFVDNNKELEDTDINVAGTLKKIRLPKILGENSYNNNEYIILILSNSYKNIICQCKEYEQLREMKCYIYPLMLDEFFTVYQKQQWIQERLVSPVINMYKEIMRINSETEEVIIETQKLKSRQMNEDGRFIIPKLNFLVTTKCTLKCQDCIGMIPYMKGEHCDKHSVVGDMNNFFRCVDECTVVEIGGGEPFLYPDIEEILRYLIDERKVIYIRIPTNGTIIPSDSVAKLLQNEKVSLYISNYGFERITTRFLSFVKENHIKYFWDKDMKWIDAGGIYQRDKSSLQKMMEYYSCAAGKLCKTVYKGRLYHCARAARMQVMDSSIVDDSIELNKNWEDTEMREKVKSFFLKTNCASCDYCDLASADAEIIKAGIQLK